MTVPSYTEEDVERYAAELVAARGLTFNPNDRGIADAAETKDWCLECAGPDGAAVAAVRIILAALSSAGRLVPPGSEVREEWRLRFNYLDGSTGQLRTADEHEARSWARNHRDCTHGTEMASSRVITTPWSPSVPDTEESSDA